MFAQKAIVLTTVIWSAGAGLATANARIICVDDDAPLGGDGRCWTSPFKYLQDALAVAEAGDQIYVAGGVYKPDQDEAGNFTPGDREAVFQLVDGVGMYGGCAGYRAAEPDKRHLELYESVLSGNIGAPEEYDDNSCCVVTTVGVSESTILDGFTVTAAYNSMWCDEVWWVSGMANRDDSNPTIVNCTFRDNGDGGMYNSQSSPTLARCIFDANRSNSSGGGMYNSYSNPTLVGCLFDGNLSTKWGGGIYSSHSNLTVVNCVFRDNLSTYAGGGIHSNYGGSFSLTNCTLVGNTSGSGAALSGGTTDGALANCIVWDNGPPETALSVNPDVTISYSNVEGGYPGPGNIDSDPLFADPGAGDFRLTECSPCNDAGDNGSVPLGVVTDFDGNPRVHAGVVDMGAYEFQGVALPPVVPALTDVAASVYEYCDRIVVTWADVPQAEGYSVFRNSTYLGDAGASPFVDLTAEVGEPYRYHVTAWNTCASAVSNVTCGVWGFNAGAMTGYPRGGLEGFRSFWECFAGPQSAPTPPLEGCLDACLYSFDYNEDGDVDLEDFSVYQSGCSAIACDDGLFCNGTEVCDESGACVTHYTADCNGNAVEDQCDISSGDCDDCNENGVPDDCEVPWAFEPLVSSKEADSVLGYHGQTGEFLNQVLEYRSGDGSFVGGFAAGRSLEQPTYLAFAPIENDCNANDIPDECDIAEGTSADLDGDGVPDECGNILFVDAGASPGGDGMSWQTAFTDLQDALSAASGEGQVWVAAGVYTPDGPSGDRAATFQLIDGTAIYGGFAGDETSLHERDWRANETVLSGDLNDNDGPGWENRGENSYHVVTGSNVGGGAVLDGFTVTAGYAEVADNVGGGGILIRDGSPTIRHCAVTDNATDTEWPWDTPPPGGGIYCDGGSPAIIDCLVRGNRAAHAPGDPFSIQGAAGGGMYFKSATPFLARCIIVDNAAGRGAGGACPLECCPVDGGDGGAGGGICLVECSATIVDTLIAFNQTGAGGKGVICEGEYGSCIAYGDGGDSGSGAGLYLSDSTANLSNCTIYGNRTGYEGYGGTGGSDGNRGCGGALCARASSVTLTNSILWDDSPGELCSTGGEPGITHSDVGGGYPGEGNINADPRFVDPDGPDDVGGTPDDDLHLTIFSPCVNAGDPSFVPEPGDTDLGGAPRRQCGRVDMGAYESALPCTFCDDVAD